jgi:hypothetical protein
MKTPVEVKTKESGNRTITTVNREGIELEFSDANIGIELSQADNRQYRDRTKNDYIIIPKEAFPALKALIEKYEKTTK